MAHSFYSWDRMLRVFLDLSSLTLAYLLALFTRSAADISSSLTLFYETWSLALPLQFLSLWYFGVFYERWRRFFIYDRHLS